MPDLDTVTYSNLGRERAERIAAAREDLVRDGQDPRRAVMVVTEQPARDDLCRSAPFELLRADDEPGDGLTLEGYGAVTNSVTHIDSWEGSFDEVIAPGAFKKSLRERTPRMQFDHGRHPLIGSIPLGVYTLAEEDDHGLHVAGRLTDNWLIQPVRDAIRDGGVEGMSFRFSIMKEDWTDKDGKKVKDEELWDLLWYGAGDRGPLLRTLKELKVSEVGPVVWPAYDDTSVGVRSVVRIDLANIDAPGTRRDLARALFIADAHAAGEAARTRLRAADQAALRRSLTEEGWDPHTAREWSLLAFTRATEPPATPVAGARPEPRSTATPAGGHPTGPPSTDDAAGEHSSASDRRARIRAGLNAVAAANAKIETKE